MKKKIKKENKIISFFKRNSFKNLNLEIKGYGYEYNFKSFILQLIAFLIVIFVAGYFYLLKPLCMGILLLVSLLVFPVIIRAQFKYMYNNKRFQNMVNYLEKMIIFFKQDPKILSSLSKTRRYVDETTRQCIDQALEILENDMSSERYSKALKVIEDEYHSSRIISLHRFMITVEEKSSQNYFHSLGNVDFDLKEWVNRIYSYQLQLKTKKMQVMVSLIASIVLLGIFSIMWVEVDSMAHVISNPVYQILATIFLISSILMFAFVQSKVNGQWLIEDHDDKENNKLLNKIKRSEDYTYKKALVKQIPKMLLFFLLSIYCAYVGQKLIAVVLGLIVGYLFYEPISQQKGRKKSIARSLATEFPLWLRDVALNLNNYVVVGAIKNSRTFVSPAFKKYLDNLLEDVDQNPTSIEPFVTFLQEYDVPDVTTCMLSLYSLQYVSEDESAREVTDLIQRNQNMLANAEKLRNQNALIGVLVISFIPILLSMFKIIIDMVIMLLGIFSNVVI